MEKTEKMEKVEKKFLAACRKGKLEKVIEFLQNPYLNADAKDEKNYNETPLIYACFNGHIEVVKVLLNNDRADINLANKYNCTPLYWACQSGKFDVVKLLLRYSNLEIDSADNYDGFTPLMNACSYGHLEIVQLFLASGREIKLDIKANNGKTVFDLAREKAAKGRVRSANIVELLEAFEKDPNETRAKLREQLGLDSKIFFFFFSFFIFFLFIFLYFYILFS